MTPASRPPFNHEGPTRALRSAQEGATDKETEAFLRAIGNAHDEGEIQKRTQGRESCTSRPAYSAPALRAVRSVRGAVPLGLELLGFIGVACPVLKIAAGARGARRGRRGGGEPAIRPSCGGWACVLFAFVGAPATSNVPRCMPSILSLDENATSFFVLKSRQQWLGRREDRRELGARPTTMTPRAAAAPRVSPSASGGPPRRRGSPYGAPARWKHAADGRRAPSPTFLSEIDFRFS
jgi:hypothetical protein